MGHAFSAVQWEKLIHTHTKANWIRLPSRLPVALVIWLLALLFPFYDTINSIMGAFGNKYIFYLLICICCDEHVSGVSHYVSQHAGHLAHAPTTEPELSPLLQFHRIRVPGRLSHVGVPHCQGAGAVPQAAAQMDWRLDRRVLIKHCYHCLLPGLWRWLWCLGGRDKSNQQRPKSGAIF